MRKLTTPIFWIVAMTGTFIAIQGCRAAERNAEPKTYVVHRHDPRRAWPLFERVKTENPDQPWRDRT